MLQFTVPLYTHKKTQIIAYCANGTQTLAQVYVRYRSWDSFQTKMSWHQLCSSQRAEAAVEGHNRNVYVVFETGYSIENHHHRLHVRHKELNPASLTQKDKHYITFIAFVCIWMWSDLCDPFGDAILLKDHFGRHAVIKPFRWSLKQAKCTVCLSSDLLRGNLAFTRHT